MYDISRLLRDNPYPGRGIIVMYILGIIAFTSLTAHPAQSNTEETSQVIVGTETDT